MRPKRKDAVLGMLTKRETVTTLELQRKIRAARKQVAILVHAAARERGLAISGRNREALYAKISGIYLQLDNGLKNWSKDMVRDAAIDWHDAAIRDIAGDTGIDPSNNVTRFSREYAEDVWKRVTPENGRSLFATLTDKMSETDIKALRDSSVDVFREAALSGMTSTEIAREIQARWDGIAGDMFGPPRFVDNAGRAWESDRYMQMLVRTTTARVARDSYFNTLSAAGDDLVQIENVDGDACEICSAWDGVILSISGASRQFPSYNNAVSAGWGHPNCRCSALRVDETIDKTAIKAQADAETPDFARRENETQSEYRQRMTENVGAYGRQFWPESVESTAASAKAAAEAAAKAATEENTGVPSAEPLPAEKHDVSVKVWNSLSQERRSEILKQETNNDAVTDLLKSNNLKPPRNSEYTYELKAIPLKDLKPTQFGEDAVNDSSRATASDLKAAVKGKLKPFVSKDPFAETPSGHFREADAWPITVWGETSQILDGNHRYAAAVMNGQTTIQALVVTEKTKVAKKTAKEIAREKELAAGREFRNATIAEQKEIKNVAEALKQIPDQAWVAISKNTRPLKFKTGRKASYDDLFRQITVSKNPKNWHGHASTIHHEVGHDLHYVTKAITHTGINADLQLAIAKDLESWEIAARQRLGHEKFVDTYSRAKSMVGARDILEQYKIDPGKGFHSTSQDNQKRVSGFLDTIGGMSKGAWGNGHKLAYYQDGNKGAKEVYANIFRAIVNNWTEYDKTFPLTTRWIRNSLSL